MIAALVYMFALLAVGYAEGDRDAGIIGNHAEIKHAPRWRFRVFMALLLCAPVVPFLLWRTLLVLPIAYGTFNTAFRFTLNTRRGKDCSYVAWGNAYDRVFLRLVFRRVNPDDRIRCLRAHDDLYNYKEPTYYIKRDTMADLLVNVEWYRSLVHRAGLIAYLTEWVAVHAAFVALYLTR